MAEHFWIQGDDGKMEGSLPGVPKQGNGQEAAKQNRKLSPFLKQLRKNMEKRKNRAALVSDKQPVSSVNTEKPNLFETSKKGLKYAAEATLAAYAMLDEYTKMIELNDRLKKDGVKTAGLDKYFHCKAHCKAARFGPGGVSASERLGFYKEVFDVIKYRITTNMTMREIIKDSEEDMEANATGRLGNPNKSCTQVCNKYWPPQVDPDKYGKYR